MKHKYHKTVWLTPEELDEIWQAFLLFDKDGSEQIDKDELKEAMRALGFKLSPEKVQKLMDNADKDGSGSIDFNEFKILMARFISKRDVDGELRKAFKMYDDDDGGTIGLDNLQSVRKDCQLDPVYHTDEDTGVKTLQSGITDEELKLMLKIGDPNNTHENNEVDFLQFMEIMKKANLVKDPP